MKPNAIIMVFLFGLVFSCVEAQRLHLKYVLQMEGEQQLNYDLYFDGARSVFILKDSELQQFEQNRQGQARPSDNSSSTVIDVKISDGKDFFYHKDFQTREMISREFAFDGKKIMVKDSLPIIDWELTGEKKKIADFSCQKATTTWRCSDYEVWFTSDIPVDIGPWKLGGLPGMIVEAHNKTVDHHYKLTWFSTNVAQVDAVFPRLESFKDPVYTFSAFAEKQRKEMEKLKMFLIAQAGNPDDIKFAAKIPECY